MRFLVIIGLVIFTVSSSFANTPPSDNTVPMYGCDSYEDYISRRTDKQKKADEELISSILSTTKLDPVAASQQAIFRGWQLMDSGDRETARKRFNQAWLIDRYNYNVFWLFAISYAQEDKYTEATKNFNQALKMYNAKYEVAKGDHTRLVCDAAYCLISSASKEKDEISAKGIVKNALKMIEDELKVSPEPCADCYVDLALGSLALDDKNKAEASLKEAIKIDPKLKEDKKFQDLLRNVDIKLE